MITRKVHISGLVLSDPSMSEAEIVMRELDAQTPDMAHIKEIIAPPRTGDDRKFIVKGVGGVDPPATRCGSRSPLIGIDDDHARIAPGVVVFAGRAGGGRGGCAAARAHDRRPTAASIGNGRCAA
jgi:hypothetical protein